MNDCVALLERAETTAAAEGDALALGAYECALAWVFRVYF